ncbi:MAG TPA: hypothetical protein VLX92_09530 [Kofleriaceae bacterium]|nr:hypothetical protein [Kofleriaceae bacterium]
MVDPLRVVASDQPIGERRELPGEQLGALAIALREPPGLRSSLQIDHTDRWGTHRSTQHRFDLVLPDTPEILEPFVEVRRGRLDRDAFADRAGDDAARDRLADLCEIAGGTVVRLPERRTIRILLEQLEVRRMCARHLDDQRERLIEQRLDLVLPAQVQQTAVEITLARDAVVAPRTVGFHGRTISDRKCPVYWTPCCSRVHSI